MDFIVSLAHWCEVHGPTSILCTQVLPVACHSCSPPLSDAGSDSSPPYSTVPSLVDLRKESQHRSNSEPSSRAPSFTRRPRSQSKQSQKSSLSKQRHQDRPSHQRKTSASSSIMSSAIETPPLSPRHPNGSQANLYSSSLDRDSAPMPAVTSPDSCANCSLSLPKGVSEQIPAGAPGSPRPDGSGKNGSPILRTRDEYIVGRHSSTLGFDTPSDNSDNERDRARRRRREFTPSTQPYAPTQLPSPPLESGAYSIETVRPRSRPTSRRSTATSASNSSSGTSTAHRHAVNYITSRHPSSPTSFSLLRSSCIRTLSCEQLPQTTSGPLYFGNRASGSTLAYVFRIPDPRALGRGRKRSYALILLGADERRTMAVSAWVLRRFEALADWIVSLAEKTNDALSVSPMPGSTGLGTPPSSASSTESAQRPPSSDSKYAKRSGAQVQDGNVVSAFLSGRSTWNQDSYYGYGFGAGGMPPRQAEVRAKGLAELCGKEDIFVELHRQFVCLLVQIVRGVVGGGNGVGAGGFYDADAGMGMGEGTWDVDDEEDEEDEREDYASVRSAGKRGGSGKKAKGMAIRKRDDERSGRFTKGIEDGLRRQVLV